MIETTDKEMIALTNEELKDKFEGIERTIEELASVVQWLQQGHVNKEDHFEGLRVADEFAELCDGFEHLCAGVLKSRNYSGEVEQSYVDGLLEIFKKIMEKI